MIRIVKRSKKSSWPSWEKQQSIPSSHNKNNWRTLLKIYLPTMIFASWLGTYLDIILVSYQMYSFPLRPFADTFSMNVLFTLFALPIFTIVVVHFLQQMQLLDRILSVLILSFLMTFVEILSEKIGWFVHSPDWRHYYTFIGYFLFMWIVLHYHRFIYTK